MIIRIDQRGSQYFVYENDASKPSLLGKWWGWFNRTADFIGEDKKEKISIKNLFRLDFWKATFPIQIPELDLDTVLKPVRYFKGHWRLENGQDIYDYYIHKGHRKSLFKNRNQIAAYDKKYFHLFEKDTIYISANDNEPVVLLISFAIAFDIGSDNGGSSMTLDLGNLGSEMRPFDEKWKPK